MAFTIQNKQHPTNRAPLSPKPQTTSRRKSQVTARTSYEDGAAALRPSSAQTEQARIQPTSLNAQIAQSDAAKKELPHDLAQKLKSKGYLVYSVNSLNVLNAAASQNKDQTLRQQKVGQGGYKLVTSGTFYYHNGAQNVPAGAVMRDGVLDTPGVPKAAERGGIAVLKDGSIVLGRMTGSSSADIQNRFGQPNNPVVDFLGGGALLIENGKIVSSEDLKSKQKFDQGGDGIYAQQMRKTDHIVVAIRDGRCFVIVARNKTGKQIQEDLAQFGFDTVIKLDGGSGAYARDAAGQITGGTNPTGLGIK